MLNLTLAEKGGETKHLTFEKEEVILGRVQGNDIVLPKGNVSKKHCRIFVQGGRFQVQDLGSTNGTYVNGRKIGEATVVSATDKIYVGDYIVKVENAAQEAAAPSGPPEAGSLSTALPRRPPPPPPPRLSSPGIRAVSDEEAAPAAAPPPPPPPKPKSAGRATLPPPPPPPKRDTSSRPFSAVDEDLDAPPSPGEVDLDDEAAKPPKLSVPPLKSALASLTEGDDDIDDRAESPEAKTASKGRAALPSLGGSPSGIPAGPDAIASWLAQQIAAEGVTGLSIGPADVEIERDGHRELVPGSEGKPIGEALRVLAGRGTPRPSTDAAAVDVTLSDGARLRALFPPAVDAACGTLFPAAKPARSLGDLVAAAAISKELRELLEGCLSTGRNLLVAGDGGSALALMGALAGAVPPGSRAISLVPGLVGPPGRLVTVARDARLPDPHATAAALRPDLLFVGIDDAALASWVITQAATGEGGVIAMGQGRSAGDALARLAALGAAGLGGVGHARELLAACFDAVIHITRLADGSVRVTELIEPHVEPGGVLAVDTVVAFRAEGASGRFQAAPSSRLAATLSARGAGPGRR
jgi:pilus assembly protein CpaF